MVQDDTNEAIAVFLETIRSTQSQWRCNIVSYPLINAALLKHADEMRPLPSHSKYYQPKYTPGRGVGLFALRSFAIGEIIIIERPSVITPHIVFGNKTPLGRMWEGFSDEETLNLSFLHNRHKKDAEAGQPWQRGVQRTNGFGFDLPTPHYTPSVACPGIKDDWPVPDLKNLAKLHSMLFLDASRLNHSCSPNTISRWNKSQMTLRVYVVNPISAGEEITTTYTTLCDPQAELQQDLLKKYGFMCDCPGCGIPARLSDARRKRLDADETDEVAFALFQLSRRWTRPGLLRVQKECRQICQLAEQEGLGAIKKVVAIRQEWLACIHAPLGEKGEFEVHTKEAIWAWELGVGEHLGEPQEAPLIALKKRWAHYQRVGPSAIPDWGICA